MVNTRSHTVNKPDMEEVPDYELNASATIEERFSSIFIKRKKILEALSRFRAWFDSQKEKSPSAALLKLRLADFSKIKDQFDQIQTEIESVDSSTEELEHAAIRIKPFSGSFTEWLPFLNTFNALVHDEPKYKNRNVEKFHQLRNSLRGDAFSSIQNIPICAENYEVAFTLLRDRFENKKLIVQHHTNDLFNLPQVSKDSSRSLRELLTQVQTNLQALKSLNIHTESWDPVIIHVITAKLDFLSRKGWEESLTTTEPPSQIQIINYLTQRCNLLEAMEINKSLLNKTHGPNQFCSAHNSQKPANKFHAKTSNFPTQQISCQFCKKSHFIFNCTEFLKLTVSSRSREILRLKLCANCFKPSHEAAKCKASGCKLCHQKHNTLLHSEANLTMQNQNQSGPSNQNNCNQTSMAHVLLSTAMVSVKDSKGHLTPVRVFLDAGAQSNFISKSICNKLGLKVRPVNIAISGIQNAVTTVHNETEITLNSNCNSYSAKIKCLVLPTITENIPSSTIDKSEFHLPSNIALSDAEFNISRPVDILIGAELFWELMCVGQIKLSGNGPVLQKTMLGWVIGGPVQKKCQNISQSCNVAIANRKSLEQEVAKFWLLESFDNNKKRFTTDEQACENYFLETVTRNKNGRFQVKLPFHKNKSEIGNSFEIAFKRFLALERKLTKNDQLKFKYQQFIQEYLAMGHMELHKSSGQTADVENYFLPHHAVFKSGKIRVVFDGSAKSSTGTSLNDALLVGPKIQNDIFDIILRFRTVKFAFTADICKMYRQILVDPDDRNYQQIIWREDRSKPIDIYKLNTVSYGTACAPYLAIRCLNKLADDEENNFPEASKVIKSDFYVDDVLTGANTLHEAKTLRDQLVEILSRGCFELSKWATNDPRLFPTDGGVKDMPTIVNFDCKTSEAKTLGLFWNTKADVFRYNFQTLQFPTKITKRNVLSTTAKIYDPLGLLGPITVKAKILLQNLWEHKINWDESIPTHLHTIWSGLVKDFSSINNLTIPRNICPHPNQSIELHCFSDASENAYGGAIYVRVIGMDGSITVNLACAKSRVAPLKTTTLPRLELCGALLISQLSTTVIKALKLHVAKTYYWTDSQIVLSWIKSPSHSLKTFVANRVAEIQTLTSPEEWRHVPSENNPADIISRGMSPSQLIQSNAWWHGPDFLKQNIKSWPQPVKNQNLDAIPEKKKIVCSLQTVPEWDILLKFSNFIKLQRVVALCRRFINNCKNPNNKVTAPLNTHELNESLKTILKHVQATSFASDIQSLTNSDTVHRKSNLLNLSPFVDSDGIIRVGGRLNNNPDFSETKKHPYLLPKNHFVTTLIIKHTHKVNLHSGAQATLAALREQFWVVSGRSTIRNVLQKCITCFRVKPKLQEQLMGDLPSYRIKPSRTFSHTGLDYAGPLTLNLNRGRGKPKISKSYIGVFVCMTTKAVHLELILDCTMETFLNALKRFVARRGKPQVIHSDNAKTFVGADNELKRLVTSTNFGTEIIQNLVNQGINWSFIPPSAPHMGGLWESCVKMTKFHLKRVMGNSLFNFEELTTLLNQVEACLNSRPITPLSNDPNDLSVLTPGHFLVGAPLTAIPESDITSEEPKRLSRWQHVTQAQQHFWKRWSLEYLGQLQQRGKWRINQDSVQINDLVIIKDDNSPPLVWRTGRVIQTHPGKDNKVRVVTVKTANGTVKRPVAKVCVLPIEQ